jgi:hypothetical protein
VSVPNHPCCSMRNICSCTNCTHLLLVLRRQAHSPVSPAPTGSCTPQLQNNTHHHTPCCAHQMLHTICRPPDTTSMLCDLWAGSAQPGGPCLHTTYSYGTRFMPSRVAVTTATSATCNARRKKQTECNHHMVMMLSCRHAWQSPLPHQQPALKQVIEQMLQIQQLLMCQPSCGHAVTLSHVTSNVIHGLADETSAAEHIP